MTALDQTSRLKSLDARIKAARAATTPKPRAKRDDYTAAGLAWRMVFELITAMVVGTAMGWGLDSLFGTLPLFLIVFWLLGFGAGIRLAMQTGQEVQRKQALAADADRPEPGRASER
ncbi:MAG: AtpZ/AtpI family protein [Pseudomonadota bacterium]